MTALALAGYLSTLWGYPIAPVRDTSGVPFPCQGHHCGCLSAAQCWSHCCCYTHSERLAWAKAHGVEIPLEYQTAMLAEAEHEHERAGQRMGNSACCAHDRHDHDEHVCTAGAVDDDADERTTGEHDHDRASDTHALAAVVAPQAKSGCTHCKPRTSNASTDGNVVWVLGFQAQKCRGITVMWVASGASLPGVDPIDWQFEWILHGSVTERPVSFTSLALVPPVPPPQA